MFTANCQCGKINVSSKRDIKRWTHFKCDNCYSKVCVYKNNQLIHNYNSNFFNASCVCGEFHFTDKTIPKHWSQMKCKKCDSKMIIKDQEKNIVYNFQTKKQKKQKVILPKIQEEKSSNKKIIDTKLIQKITEINQYCFETEKKEEYNPVKNDVFMGINLYEQSLVQPTLQNEINDLFHFIMAPVM